MIVIPIYNTSMFTKCIQPFPANGILNNPHNITLDNLLDQYCWGLAEAGYNGYHPFNYPLESRQWLIRNHASALSDDLSAVFPSSTEIRWITWLQTVLE